MVSKWENLPPKAVPREIVTILAVSQHDDDVAFLRRTFHHPQWRIEWVRSCEAARELFTSLQPSVVLCERDLPDGDWRNVLEIIRSMTDPPNLVVASRLADEYLWAEVLNLGGYDVLVKPLDAGEVLRVIGMASRQYTSRQPRKAAKALTAESSSYLYGS